MIIWNSAIFTVFISGPCEAGKFLDQTDGCQDCPKDTWSAAGNTADSCTSCPVDKEVTAGQGKQESDCTWSEWFCPNMISYINNNVVKF